MMCPLSKFMSKFNTQIFIENLDLSHNDHLYNTFASFVFRHLEGMDTIYKEVLIPK